MAEPFHKLNIDWDFDEESKSLLFNPVVKSTGNDLFFSFCDSMKSFYEVSGCSCFNIYVNEIYQNNPIFINGVTKPFIYIKNIGSSDAIFIASNSGLSGDFFNYNNSKISGIVNSSCCNYIISPNQSFVLTIHGNVDGSNYFSSGCYPFGFYYNFNNITGINLNSEFPACTFNSKNIFLYEELSGVNYNFIDTGSCNLNIENCLNLSFDKPISGSGESLFLKNNSYLLSECSNLFNASCECFTFETWFKAKNNFSQNCIDVAGLFDLHYLNLLSIDKFGSLSAGTCSVSGKNGYCYCSNQNFICFGFEAGGVISTGQLDGKFSLDSSEFTIEFFTQLRSSPSPDNHSLISMSGLELNLYSDNPSWPSFLIGDNCYDFTSCEIADHIGIGSDFKHIAISKYSDCIKIFVDGCTIFQTGYTGILNFTGDYLNLGSSASSCWLAGSISNFRIIKNKGLYKKDFFNCKVTMPLGGYFCGVFGGNCYIDNVFYQEAGAFPTGEVIGYSGVAFFRNCSLDNLFLNTGNWFNELDLPICQIPTGNYSCIYICNETVRSYAPLCFQNLFLINSCFCNLANFSYGNILAIGNSEIERVDNCGDVTLCDNSCISLSNIWGYSLNIYQDSVANSNNCLAGEAKLIASGFSGSRFQLYCGSYQYVCYINGNGGVACCFAERYNFIKLNNNECVAFLGLTGSNYDSGFNQGITGALNCNIFEGITNLIFTGFNVFNFISETGLVKNNEWNHYALTVSGLSGNMYLNGCKVLGPCEIYKTPIMNDSRFILNCSVYYNTEEEYFYGLVNNLKYIKDCILYTGNFLINSCFTAGDFFAPITFTCENYSDLFIKSNSFDSFVDNCANLKIKTSGVNEIIESGLSLFSSYGCNCFHSNIKINKILLYLNNELQCSYEQQFPSNLVETVINSNLNYKIVYYPEFICNKVYNFKYLRSGTEGDSCQSICKNNLNEINLNLSVNCLNEFSICDNASDLILKLNLNNNFSIKDVRSKNLIRDNLFMPVYEDFNYDYSYCLGDVNNGAETGNFSNWANSAIENNYSFINCVDIVSCEDLNFVNNKPILQKICINFDENRFNTNSLSLNKNKKSSENFYTIKSTEEKSFFYKGLEFKYFPVLKVIYDNLIFEVPDKCVNICLSGIYCSINFNFPISALNDSKIVINSDYETIEFVCYNNLYLQYPLFSLNLVCQNCNNLSYTIPKIISEDLCNYESPNANINVDFDITLQKSISLNINPYADFTYNDPNYGLTNLLFLISSEINSGIANQRQYSFYDTSNPTVENGGLIDDGYETGGYIYNSSWSGVLSPSTGFGYKDIDYNFLMIDLWDEITLCSFQSPSGDGCFLIDEKISFEKINLNTIIPYKSFSGAGYNYLIPISNCLTYVDQTEFMETGLTYNCFTCFNNLNYLKFNHIFESGATGYVSITDISGEVICCCVDFLKKSIFNYDLGNYNIRFDCSDISQSTGDRLVCINKFYGFSGVQPICIYSNYPLSEMKSPIVSKNLNPYEYDGFSSNVSGYYYYFYSINEQKETNLKFVSPDCTYFSQALWFDFEYEKNINLFESNLNNGMIQENTSLIKFNIKPLLNENPLFYDESSIKQYICFCVGGYL